MTVVLSAAICFALFALIDPRLFDIPLVVVLPILVPAVVAPPTTYLSLALSFRLGRADEALRIAQTRFRDGIDSLSGGFALYDADDRLVLFNQAFFDLNILIQDLIVVGQKYQTLVRAAAERGQIVGAKGKEEEWIQERLAQHRKPTGAFERQVSDGRWFLVTERPTNEGGIVGSWTEITDLKRAEEALQISEERFRSIFRNAHVGLIRGRTKGQIVEANQRAADILGYASRDDLIANYSPKKHWVDVESRTEFVEKGMKTGSAHDFELEVQRTDGSPIRRATSSRKPRSTGFSRPTT